MVIIVFSKFIFLPPGIAAWVMPRAFCFAFAFLLTFCPQGGKKSLTSMLTKPELGQFLS